MNTQKILLIHPLGANWTSGEKDFSRIANIMPPLGLCSLASYLEKQGIKTFIHDCYAFPGQDQHIFDLIEREKISWIGFSTTTSSFMDACRISEAIKKKNKDIKTVFGGVHISALKEILMKRFPIIDFGVAGEGEETLLELIKNNGNEVKGLLYRRNEEVLFSGQRENIKNIDELPFPAYEKLWNFPRAYQLPIFSYPKAPGTTAISSRGCPYQCSYCDRSVFQRSFRFHSAEYMVELLRYLKNTFNIRHINFYDDLFTFQKNRVMIFCEKLIQAGLKMTFNCAARAEHLDREMIARLKQAGCWMISLGIETGDKELLKLHRSSNNLELIKECIGWIKSADIRVKGLFMMGLPGETEDTINKSMDFVFNLGLDDFNLAKFTPFPGSPLYETIKNHGDFEESWELMNCLNFVFVPNGFTRERLDSRYHEFYRKYYQRPQILVNYLKMVYQSPDSWIRFIKNIKDFILITQNYKK